MERAGETNFNQEEVAADPNIPRDSKYDTTFERDPEEVEEAKESKFKQPVGKLNIKDLYEDAIEERDAQEAAKNQSSDAGEDDDLAQADYEEQLLKQQQEKSRARELDKKNTRENVLSNYPNEDMKDPENSMDREDYENQLLEEQENKSKMRRTNDEINLKQMVGKTLENNKSKVNPPTAATKSQQLEDKVRREKELRIIRQKQEEVKQSMLGQNQRFQQPIVEGKKYKSNSYRGRSFSRPTIFRETTTYRWELK